MSFRWITQFHGGSQSAAVKPARVVELEPAADRTLSATRSKGSAHARVDAALLSFRDQKVNDSVVFSPVVYCILWLCVLVTHALIAAAYAQECIIYKQTIGNPRMNSYLQRFGIGDHSRVDMSTAMILTSAFVSTWHVFACARAILRSLLERRLIFGLLWEALYSPADNSRDTLAKKLKRSCYLVYAVGGVRSKYFDVAFDIREVIDIASQSYQAYHICSYVADPFIQNLAIAILVLSCWSTPLLRFVLKQNEPTKRLLCLVFDVFFDQCFTIAILYLIFSFWVRLPKTNFSDPVLVVENGTVLAQALVNSWKALASSRFPILSTILVLESIKSLVKERHPQQQQPTPQQLISAKSSKSLLSLMSRKSTSSIVPQRKLSRVQTMLLVAQRGTKLAHIDVIFAVFGWFVLVVYIFAVVAARPQNLPLGCKLCMRSWLQTKHPCAVFEINYLARGGIMGTLQEIDLALSDVSLGQVRGLIFAHCPALHVPPRIQELSSLLILVVFNSTIVDWGDNAALTGHRHSQLAILLMVRVDFTEFPRGLLSMHFPSTLVDFKVHQSNLTALPEESFESFWPQDFQNFVIEHSKLTQVPRFLSRKRIVGVLSLAGNLIENALLSEILSTSCSRSFLGHNPIQRLNFLPSDEDTSIPTDNLVAHLHELHLEGSSVSLLPEWMNSTPLSESGRTQSIVVFGNESPLCGVSSSSSSDDDMSNSSNLKATTEATITTLTCSKSDTGGYFASLDKATQDLNG